MHAYMRAFVLACVRAYLYMGWLVVAFGSLGGGRMTCAGCLASCAGCTAGLGWPRLAGAGPGWYPGWLAGLAWAFQVWPRLAFDGLVWQVEGHAGACGGVWWRGGVWGGVAWGGVWWRGVASGDVVGCGVQGEGRGTV